MQKFIGTKFILAGNTTQNPQSAVLASSPIACQVSKGRLRFKYWLYNAAKVEVIILKLNPSHGHLQVRSRPKTDCTFLKSTEHECIVEIDEMHEPFKIGIRAFQLHDSSVGSLALLTNIHYEAQVCRENEVPSLFGGIPLSSSEPSQKQIFTASDLNCLSKVSSCLWSPFYPAGMDHAISLRSLWQSGNNQRLWNEFVPTSENTHPEKEFIFQYIDPMSSLPIGQLQSALIPCTATSSSLQFKYWMSSNVQAQVCTVTQQNVSLSCVFLNEAASPGPVTIDIDRGDKNPFKFVIEVIKFDRARAGIFAVDDIVFTGRLCHERAPETTPTPLGIGTLFELQPFPHVTLTNGPPISLACSFEDEDCSHWENDDDTFQSGFVPARIPFKLPKNMKGNVAVALFTRPESFAILQSPVISCAENARISVFYFSSLGARISICADDKCLKEKPRENNFESDSTDTFGHAGELSVNVTTTTNFRLRIVAESVNEDDSGFAESFVLVKKITTEGHICRMKDDTELACEHLFCDFRNGTLCNYNSALTTPDDVPFQHDPRNGIQATLSTAGRRRVVLRSPEFKLSRPAELRFRLLLSTYGAVAYMCPDEFVDNLTEDCELLLGPKIDQSKFENLQVQLDPDISHFAIIAYHDKYQQFGKADVIISDISLVDANGQALCNFN
uniref:MAM domain-containing protein n=1 Tax=Panagrolaimus superbus TaxID=310955 RepID=A0A914Z0N4_9BILA